MTIIILVICAVCINAIKVSEENIKKEVEEGKREMDANTL